MLFPLKPLLKLLVTESVGREAESWSFFAGLKFDWCCKDLPVLD